jgi:hypothetical protein
MAAMGCFLRHGRDERQDKDEKPRQFDASRRRRYV